MAKDQNSSKILVVDDEKEIREMLSDFLESEGYDVSAAKSGQEALELAKKIEPALLMLDVVLPDLDGIAVYEKICAMTPLVRVPVIFFTALGEGIPAAFRRQMKSTSYRLIPKPVSTKTLLQQVGELLKES